MDGHHSVDTPGGLHTSIYVSRKTDAITSPQYQKHRFWTKSSLAEKPSFYWYRQGHATFIEDHSGVAPRHSAGIDNIMWSTDYPHSDTTWPRSREVLAEPLQGRA